jgi:hypothetical protein
MTLAEETPSKAASIGAPGPALPRTNDSVFSESGITTEVLLAVRSELYNELRSYRDKEMQTFLFAFPVIGAGYTSIGSVAVKALLTALATVVTVYIVGNHDRMMRIKGRIVGIQHELGVGALLSGLAMGEWAMKPFYRHLGTMAYLVLIGAETVGLWIVSVT